MKTPTSFARAVCCAVLVLCCIAAQSADNPDVRHEAAEFLLHRTVYIRDAYKATYLHFNEAGEILNGARTGFWSDAAGVYSTRVEFWPSGVLHIEGDRVAVGFNQRKAKWEDVRRDSANVVIEVQFSPADLNVEQVRKTLNAIFVPTREALMPELPAYWRPCVLGDVKKDPADHDRPFCFDKGVTPDMKTHAPVNTDVPAATGTVVPAHAIEAPQPRYTEVGREMHVSGTTVLWLIVDEQGRPAEIYVASPLGYGLDDQAVDAIGRWRFRPARLNGRPVRTQMTVAVNFKTPTGIRRILPW